MFFPYVVFYSYCNRTEYLPIEDYSGYVCQRDDEKYEIFVKKDSNGNGYNYHSTYSSSSSNAELEITTSEHEFVTLSPDFMFVVRWKDKKYLETHAFEVC